MLFTKDLTKGNPKEKSDPFILAVEGIDFSGKTTLACRIQTALTNLAYRVKLLHDPKGSPNGRIIWDAILTLKQQAAHPITEFFLFLAARNELIYQEALVGKADIIIFDRFIFSTIAYQLTHQSQYWELFLTLHRSFSNLVPNLCIYCDIDFHTFQLRKKARSKKDPFDQMTEKRFNAIKGAYDQTLQRTFYPSLRVDLLSNESFALLIDNIVNHIKNK